MKIFLVLFLWSGLAHAQGFIGNNGEGILENGNLYLRDLWEQDIHLNPYFGTARDDHFGERLKNFKDLNLTPAQSDLLLRKLTDIEAKVPCAGGLLIEGLFAFTWVFEKNPLALVADDEAVRYIPIEKRRAIANRFSSTIKIHRDTWNSLNDENKIALVIHELIFAAQIPKCADPNCTIKKQSVADTRNIVAILFKDIVLRQNQIQDIQTRLGLQMIEELEPSAQLKTCRPREKTYEIRLIANDELFKSEHRNLRMSSNLQNYQETVEEICRKGFQVIKDPTGGPSDFPPHYYTAIYSIDRLPFKVSLKSYNAFDFYLSSSEQKNIFSRVVDSEYYCSYWFFNLIGIN